MAGNSKYKIAIPYFGGKFSHLEWLLPLLPKCNHFVDLFCGSLAVSLNREPSPIETVNDLNDDIIHFFSVLRNDPEQLIRQLKLTPYSEAEYRKAWEQCDDSIERARRFFVRSRMSYGSMGAQQRNKGWNMATKTSRCQVSESVNRWIKGTEKLFELVSRLKMFQISNKHFSELLQRLNDPGVLIYADPPYDFGIRTGKQEYKHDFTEDDHRELAHDLNTTKSMVALSGYDTPLMRALYQHFYMTKGPVTKKTLSKSPRQECLWTNYNPLTINGQLAIAI